MKSTRHILAIFIKRKGLFLFFFFHCLCTLSYAQNYPVYNHWYVNPFLHNPAEAGSEMRAVAFLNHRQQWRGVEGAPVLSTLSFHLPFNKSNAIAGLNVSSFNRGLLTTTDATFTAGYAIPINEETYFKLGLSAGLLNNSVDLTMADNPDDPALIGFANNNNQLVGKFGMKIQSNGFNLGLVLPQLFSPDFINTSSFESFPINPFDEILIMGYYKKRVDSYFKKKSRGRKRYTKKVEAQYAPLELHALYRFSKIGNSQFEALVKLNLSQSFWVGGSYRQSYGITGNFGFKVNDFEFAYAYEPASKLVVGLINGSHEIQLAYRIGKIVKPKSKKKKIKPAATTKAAAPKPDDGHKARYQASDNKGYKNANQNLDGKRVIISVKSFKEFSQADTYQQYLRKRKHEPGIYFDKKAGIYHVFIAEYQKLKDAKRDLKKFTSNRLFRKARIIQPQ